MINPIHQLLALLRLRHPLDYTTDVVFIGAGPVGLWSATQAKLLNPALNIRMLERNAEYTRNNSLTLSLDSFDGTPDHPVFNELRAQIKTNPRIKTQVIEQKLKQLAIQLGIQFSQEKVADPEKLRDRFRKENVVIVGSDGSRSLFRKKIFGDRFSVQDNLQYMAQLQYKVKGSGYKLGTFFQAYPTSKLVNTLVSESVGSEVDGQTTITVQFIIDQETYEHMQEATFKNPYNLLEKNALVEKELRNRIGIWLAAKKKSGEERIPGSEVVTVTDLSVYASETFAQVSPDKKTVHALVGDSAFGVPFFKSLNNGMKCGTMLAKAIDKFFKNKTAVHAHVSKSCFDRLKREEDPFSDYSRYVQKLAGHEIFMARVKNFFINFLLWFIRISSIVPWQINKWSEYHKRQLLAESLKV